MEARQSPSAVEAQVAKEAQSSAAEEHRRRLDNRQRLRELRIKRLRAKVHIAYCLLPVAYCLLPIDKCLPVIAHCLLPTAADRHALHRKGREVVRAYE